MTFGQRNTPTYRPASVSRSVTPKKAVPGGYWIAVASVPLALLVVALAGGWIFARDEFGDLIAATPMAMVSLALAASPVLLIVDAVMKRFRAARVWTYALSAGVLLALITVPLAPMSIVYRMLLVVIPGFFGGWVLGFLRQRTVQ